MRVLGPLALILLVAESACDQLSSEQDSATPSCAADRLDWGRGGELMLPGSDCISCHQTEGTAEAHPYSLAGTVFASDLCPSGLAGAYVTITDSAGETTELVTNEVGSFFTDTQFSFPVHVSVRYGETTAHMMMAVETGACASCHAENSQLGFVWPGDESKEH